MKRITQNLKWLVTLLTMIVSAGAWGQNSAVLWEEDFSTYAKNDVPSGGTYSYTCTDGGTITKIYEEAIAGGTSPELLVSKSGGTFSATIPLDNVEGDLTLTFNTNKQTIKVSTTTTGISGGIEEKVAGEHTCTFTGVTTNMTEIVIVFTGSGSSNVRLDDIKLTGTTSGGTSTPSITVNPATVNASAEGGDGTIEVTYSNFDVAEADIKFYASDGTTSATYDWIETEINAEGNVEYLIEENEGDTRTAYFKVYAIDNDANELYSELITVTQAAYTVDYATLPFTFDGGRQDVNNTTGLVQEGLGSDYSSSPKMKFDSVGDNLILHFNERPGTLTFDILGNAFSDNGTFKVQTSEDGTTYTDLVTYNPETLTATKLSEEFNNLGENVRYIKWVYSNRERGNVALGNIKLTKYVEPVPYTLTITPNENAEIFVFYNDPENYYPEIQNGDEVLAGSEVLFSVSAKEGYAVESVSVTKGEGQEVRLTEEEEGISWTFTMPNSNVTVSCTVTEEVQPGGTIYTKVTSTDDITDGEYLIVYETGNVAFNGALETLDAVGNTVAVSISDNTIIGNNDIDAATFTINVTDGTLQSASGYYIGVSENSNGLKQTEDATTYTHSFSIDGGNAIIAADYSGSTMSLRFNSATNQNRFRYYKNAGQQAIQLYKKVVTVTVEGTLAAGKFATRIFPFVPTAIDGVKFYSCAGMQGKTTSLALTEVSAPEANVPYILENTSDAEVDITQTGVDIHENDTYTVGYLTGVFTPVTLVASTEVNNYVLQTQNGKQSFYIVNQSDINIPAYRAYLTVPADIANGVKAFNLGGDATAINTLEVLTNGAYEGIYTVDGMKLNRMEKGVNILKMADGSTRKVIVK